MLRRGHRDQGLMLGAGGAHTTEYLASSGTRARISDDHLPWLVSCYLSSEIFAIDSYLFL
jgi:hypothetical protein